jgi:predicted acyl esterase
MRATCARVARGNALRLSVAGACSPAYALNIGTGTPAAEARQIDARVIALTVSSGAAMPSRILIPERTV